MDLVRRTSPPALSGLSGAGEVAAVDFDEGAIAVPPPDEAAEPEGFLVVLEPNDRIHFLDWGGPTAPPAADGRGVLLVHGLAATGWTWSPVARRIRGLAHTVAVDLRGHGLSDAPTEGYEPEQLAEDLVAVAEGSGLLAIEGVAGEDEADPGWDAPPRPAVVLAGHGFGAIVAAWTAAALGSRCSGLVLVDGGWEDVRAASGMEPDEWLRGLDEPPEILHSMAAFLADRRAWDPATWDADQERAARASVTALPVGRLVPSTRPHALAGSVAAMFEYRPGTILPSVEAPIVALVAGAAGDPERAGDRELALAEAAAAVVAAGRAPIRVARFPGIGHALPRYRPDAVAAAILALRADPPAVR